MNNSTIIKKDIPNKYYFKLRDAEEGILQTTVFVFLSIPGMEVKIMGQSYKNLILKQLKTFLSFKKNINKISNSVIKITKCKQSTKKGQKYNR